MNKTQLKIDLQLVDSSDLIDELLKRMDYGIFIGKGVQDDNPRISWRANIPEFLGLLEYGKLFLSKQDHNFGEN